MRLDDYVGIPFADRGRDRAGCDCWGLVRLVYGERLGLSLPDGSERYARAEDPDEAWRVIADGLPDWQPVPTASRRAGDLALLREGGVPCHVGVLADRGFILHTRPGRDAVIEPFERMRARLVGIYRLRQ